MPNFFDEIHTFSMFLAISVDYMNIIGIFVLFTLISTYFVLSVLHYNNAYCIER